jgi:hypothetical protein
MKDEIRAQFPIGRGPVLSETGDLSVRAGCKLAIVHSG